jgi:hypothetical protein
MKEMIARHKTNIHQINAQRSLPRKRRRDQLKDQTQIPCTRSLSPAGHEDGERLGRREEEGGRERGRGCGGGMHEGRDARVAIWWWWWWWMDGWVEAKRVGRRERWGTDENAAALGAKRPRRAHSKELLSS